MEIKKKRLERIRNRVQEIKANVYKGEAVCAHEHLGKLEKEIQHLLDTETLITGDTVVLKESVIKVNPGARDYYHYNLNSGPGVIKEIEERLGGRIMARVIALREPNQAYCTWWNVDHLRKIA